LSEAIEPFSTKLNFRVRAVLEKYNLKAEIRLSNSKVFFHYDDAVSKILATGKDPVIYEYYENSQPSVEGHLNFGVTVIYPGKIGIEYFMTRGHYHAKEGTAEVYYGLKGEGIMLLQTRKGESRWIQITPGQAAYVPPFWAHRTVNTGNNRLYVLFAYPSDSGHDYGTIKQKGFPKLVVEERGKPKIVDNPSFK